MQGLFSPRLTGLLLPSSPWIYRYMRKTKKLISILIVLLFLCQDMAVAAPTLRVPIGERLLKSRIIDLFHIPEHRKRPYGFFVNLNDKTAGYIMTNKKSGDGAGVYVFRLKENRKPELPYCCINMLDGSGIRPGNQLDYKIWKNQGRNPIQLHAIQTSETAHLFESSSKSGEELASGDNSTSTWFGTAGGPGEDRGKVKNPSEKPKEHQGAPIFGLPKISSASDFNEIFNQSELESLNKVVSFLIRAESTYISPSTVAIIKKINSFLRKTIRDPSNRHIYKEILRKSAGLSFETFDSSAVAYIEAIDFIGETLELNRAEPEKQEGGDEEIEKVEKEENILPAPDPSLAKINKAVIDSAYRNLPGLIELKDWDGVVLALWVIEKINPKDKNLAEIEKKIEFISKQFPEHHPERILYSKLIKVLGLRSKFSNTSGAIEALTMREREEEATILLQQLEILSESRELASRNLFILRKLFDFRNDSYMKKYEFYISKYIGYRDYKLGWLSSIILSFIDKQVKIVDIDFDKVMAKKSAEQQKRSVIYRESIVIREGKREKAGPRRRRGKGGAELAQLQAEQLPRLSKITLPPGGISWDVLERTVVLKTIERFGGDIKKAASILNISKVSVYKRLREYNKLTTSIKQNFSVRLPSKGIVLQQAQDALIAATLKMAIEKGWSQKGIAEVLGRGLAFLTLQRKGIFKGTYLDTIKRYEQEIPEGFSITFLPEEIEIPISKTKYKRRHIEFSRQTKAQLELVELKAEHFPRLSGITLPPGGITWRELEKIIILQKSGALNGNRRKIADALGRSVRTIDNKLNKYRRLKEGPREDISVHLPPEGITLDKAEKALIGATLKMGLEKGWSKKRIAEALGINRKTLTERGIYKYFYIAIMKEYEKQIPDGFSIQFLPEENTITEKVQRDKQQENQLDSQI